MALKAADGNQVWIGGWKSYDKWHWSDDSTWGFTNWESGRGNDDDYYDLGMRPSGMWYDSDMFSAENYFLCRGLTVAIKKNGLTRLELKREQLISFPLILTFKSPAISQRMSNSSAEEKRLSGFTFSWFLEDSNGTRLTEKLPP